MRLGIGLDIIKETRVSTSYIPLRAGGQEIRVRSPARPRANLLVMDDVLVIGGGAAGMIAAWRAASLGARVRLLEKNDRLGLKIHISGGGKCNITHGGDMESLRRAFEPDEARFLRLAFRRFTNEDVLN